MLFLLLLLLSSNFSNIKKKPYKFWKNSLKNKIILKSPNPKINPKNPIKIPPKFKKSIKKNPHKFEKVLKIKKV